ncbi:MFS transporter [Chryseotalea sanaruensis]|uniref:MFS transporter n=2 Tax=Chryseotalea sanaruensis TaxID=2482724 RepID=A0A401U5J3_9BACT|nr:MFS transporter [Chryseotalea sanaruensis]
MLIPELSAYLTSLGGGEYKGLIIALFTCTALLSRPFSGKLADTVGRVPVMMFGGVVCIICSLLYPLLTSVSGFLLLRLMHGFSTGFTPTGLTAYLSDIIPAHKRGEAMGMLGTAGSVGMAAGPAIGGVIANQFSLNSLFYTSSLFGFISIIILLSIKETLSNKKQFSRTSLKLKQKDLFEPLVLVPCIIMLLSAYAYGAAFTLLPDLGDYVGIKNKGLLFTFLTVASLAVRLIAGKASDHFGRANILKVSTMLIALGMLVIGLGSTPAHIMIGVSIYGMAQGMTSPTLFAWATDLSDENFKGRGISSLYIFMEAGIGIGALCSGFIYANNPKNLFLSFAICSSFSVVAFLYLMFVKRAEKITI